MKRIILLFAVFMFLAFSCSKNYSGTYTGYSWKDEAKGVPLEKATEKIETVLTLDKKGIITDAKMLFYVMDKDGKWYTRQTDKAEVTVDFSVKPAAAVPQGKEQNYSAGKSMFTIQTADKMAFYSAAVNNEGTAALLIVEPFTRYQFEYRMDKGFDFSKKIKDLTIGSGMMVPTIRTSSGGYIKPDNWSKYADHNIFSFYKDFYVLAGRGILKGLNPDSTMKEMLERTGVSFSGNVPLPMDVKYGFTGIGGWEGNYRAITAYLKGKDAKSVKSLIDWNNPRYSGSISSDNFFGIDVKAGATTTVQNSADGIAGASVRMSRESASYQRALASAGIIEEKDVIKGRF